MEHWRQDRLRDELIHRVQYGEMTPDEADAEAERLGLGRLSGRPDPHVFAPELETHWTIPMAVAWIAYRSFDAVRESWESYCNECWHWIWRRWRNGPDGEVHEGWFLEHCRRPTLAELVLRSDFDRLDGGCSSMAMGVAEAENALWAALRDGLFEATGIDTEIERRVPIPAIAWHELTAVEGSGGVAEVRFGLLGQGYREARVPAMAVCGCWRAPRGAPLELPPGMAPDGDGYMPLYCAAQWIATEGGAVQIDPADETVWRLAFAALLNAIASEGVRVVGTRDGSRKPVPGFHFAGCSVDYPLGSASFEMISGEDLYLRSYPYLDEEHWRGGFDDALLNRREVRWSRLMALKADIRERWPFGLATSDKTGAPGRPTSMHLILDEFDRRAQEGGIEETLRTQSTVLVEWLAAVHPNRNRPTVKTVENRIRGRYRQQRMP